MLAQKIRSGTFLKIFDVKKEKLLHFDFDPASSGVTLPNVDTLKPVMKCDSVHLLVFVLNSRFSIFCYFILPPLDDIIKPNTVFLTPLHLIVTS